MPYTGAFPIELTIDHLGPITRTVADTALMLTVHGRVPTGSIPANRSACDGRRLRRPLSTARSAGLRIGIVSEGFGTPVSNPGWTTPCGRPSRRCVAPGCAVDEVSVPWHADAMHVWNVIATEGATAQMVDGNAYGHELRRASTTPS